uniref:ABC transmembrane type-1 domain-containing protein n=1 Tax=Romanomermis culicivorax TaxID=13658 RepID=A0A915L9Q5_ROMCU
MDELKFENMKPNPLLKANILSKLTLWVRFMNPLMRLGAKRSLEVEDQCEVMPNEDSEYLTDELEKCYEKVKHTNKKTKDQLHRAITDMFGVEFHLLGLLLLFHPFFLGRLIRYFKYCSTTTVFEAYVYAAGVSITALLLTVTHNYPYIHQINLISMRLTVALNGLIYKKVLKMKASCLQEAERGRILNLMSNDVSRMESVSLPDVPFSSKDQYLFSQSLTTTFFLRGKASHLADARITLVTDLLNRIKAIKMYVWEEPLMNVINNVRKKEINMLKIQTVLQGVLIELHFVSGKFVVLCAISAHILFGRRISAEMVFVTASLLNSIRNTMTWYLASAVQGYAEYKVTIDRIEKLLSVDDKPQAGQDSKETSKPDIGSIKIVNFSADWGSKQGTTIENITLDVQPGQLVVILGAVGSGKSTLLHSLCHETNVTGGQMIVSGRLAYVPQDPWIFSGTYLNNQRAAENLRAIYSDADIYLLDDPLSSVDASMMHSLFEKYDCSRVSDI